LTSDNNIKTFEKPVHDRFKIQSIPDRQNQVHFFPVQEAVSLKYSHTGKKSLSQLQFHVDFIASKGLQELYVRNVYQIIIKWPWYVTRH